MTNTVNRLSIVIAAIISGAFVLPVSAQSTGFCEASQKLLDRVHEKLVEWQVPEEVERMGMIRIMSRAGLARAYASDEGLAEDLQAALNVLVIARDDDDPERVPNEDVPAAIYTNILIVAGHMPDLCPDVIVPDFSTYSNFAPE